MDLLNILPALEGIARSINFGPLNDLMAKIHEIVDRILLFITPDAPVRDGGQALIGYTDHLDTLRMRLGNSKAQLQELYGGPAAEQYYTSLDQSLQLMRKTHDHLNNAANYHGQLAEHFLEAAIQQGMIVAQAGIMAVDLGSLIFTGGLDAPLSVPVAAGDAIAAEGSIVAMDVATTAAETTAEVIGESAADMGEMAFDLADEGSDVLADADTLGDDGSILGDGSEPPSEDTPLDPSGNGGEPPSDEPPNTDPNNPDPNRPVNSRGDPYPRVKDPRTGEDMPFPEGDLQRVPSEDRVEWNNQTRYEYIKEWYDRGYETPEGGWEPYDIHHILPREFGGTNDFDNLMPVLREIHNGPAPEGITAWWNAYEP